MLFTGGHNGKLLRESLQNEKINYSEIITKNESRDAAIIIDESKNKVYSFFRSDSEPTLSEVDNFILKMEKMIATCEIVVFSGSSPSRTADIIFPEGIRIAKKLDKISICDTYGNHFEKCLDAAPTIVHNNSDEIKSSLNLSMDSESDILSVLDLLYKKGVKQAFLTNAEKQFYAMNFDFHYRITLPKIDAKDSTGSGDAFTAGLIYGWQKKLNFEEQLRFAASLGICNAKSIEVCDVVFEDTLSISDQITIKPVGKKIKIINDQPD